MEAALIDWWLSKFGKLVDALMDPVLQKWYTTLQKGDYAKDDLFLRAYARENFEEEEADLIAASETAGGLVSEMAMSILGIRRADEEFEKLGLDKATNIKAIMKHKNLTVWLAKVKKLGWNPVKLLLPKLKAVSSDKEILVECFSANRLPNELRGKLQDAVFDQWAGKSGSVVLKDLGLDKAGDELFSQELILSWADYMWRLYPKTAPTEMARVLWGQYKHKLIALVARAEESDNELVGALARDIAAAVNHYASEILPGPEVPPPVAPLPDI
ncbi:uncharacterized protein PHALS_02591 [Plasmopara halstedii]|uniref:Uncharacterized protein n=1 Tax=Plasmopara halstedii TaxID=4781 RepID=A0A0P1AX72_PLAHL|nr:uncharacterized protein PHALS_02591 [Plasmopara halstedii]CEG46176.1 hypothetical protein PHALS_02591 [Plasmopara halstedii]|eukprot:XP_024582545.1 hypothetical protein PHALS_02591 [Plasmopara halstedii]